MVEMGWLVLKLKMSQVTDAAENQEPMTRQVVTMESGLSLCRLLSVGHM